MMRLQLVENHSKVALFGLDAAGKTTLCHILTTKKKYEHLPTVHPNAEDFVDGVACLELRDFGGHDQAIHLWPQYSGVVDAIIFVVDLADPARYAKSRAALAAIMGDTEDGTMRIPGVRHVPVEPFAVYKPVLVLGNKLDAVGAGFEERDFVERFGLEPLRTGRRPHRLERGVRPFEYFSVSLDDTKLRQQVLPHVVEWLKYYTDPLHNAQIMEQEEKAAAATEAEAAAATSDALDQVRRRSVV